jgi:hypothetical protein
MGCNRNKIYVVLLKNKHMKKIIIACILLSFIACKKDEQNDLSTTGLEGNWKATQWQNDIGNGSTPFSNIPAQYNYYLNFLPNNNFEGNYIFNVNNFDKYRVVDSIFVMLYKQNTTDSMRLWYELNNNSLTVSFQCIEACRLRLLRN